MSSPFWCHTCHAIVRIASSSSPLSCPSCNTGFVEEVRSEPSFLLISGNSRSADLSSDGDGSAADLSSNRFSSSRLGFLRRFFRSNRSSRQAPEGRSPLLQIMEFANSLQRSRNDEVSNGERGPEHPTDPDESSGISSMNGDNDGLSTILGSRMEEGSSNSAISAPEASESIAESLPDDMPSPRSLETVLQRLLSGILQGGRSRSRPASKAAIAAMPTFKIGNQSLEFDSCGGVEDQFYECAVCKEAFEVGGEVKEMPCKHFYHSDCILPWLAMHSSCPLCRREMPVDEEERSSSTAREPTVVFIGMAGSGVLVFSFIMLGAGGRNENVTVVNAEGEENQNSEVSVVGMASDENIAEGNVGDTGARMESNEGTSFEAGHNLSSQATETATVPHQSCLLEKENRKSQVRDGHTSCLRKEEFEDRNPGDMFLVQNEQGPSIASENLETENETSQSYSGEDHGETSTDTSGSRSRSFLSWFLRHAAARHGSSSAVEDSNESSSDLRTPRHDNSDGKVT